MTEQKALRDPALRHQSFQRRLRLPAPHVGRPEHELDQNINPPIPAEPSKKRPEFRARLLPAPPDGCGLRENKPSREIRADHDSTGSAPPTDSRTGQWRVWHRPGTSPGSAQIAPGVAPENAAQAAPTS